ncbi:SMI1/KNR4 family protein [Rhodococcus opacus]|uniref:SMI1/KNR4 family protein n=1 Tax=Rhodococcus opacus TaxID=37919 RepID=UPI001FF5B016|nr:SMI1/KNR4 family protein [Rhodococcus opacus]UOT06769.1 SMI1/KNR4 family protein [Rhodococcus opacus]
MPVLFLQTLEGEAGLQIGGMDPESSGHLIYLGNEFVVIYTGATYGPADVGVSVLSAPSECDATEWETIEEGTFAVTGQLSLIPHPSGTETSIDEIDGLTTVDSVERGLWHVRVYARGRDADRGDVAIRLHLWPAERPVPLTSVKIGDSYIPQMLATVPTQPPPPSTIDTAAASRDGVPAAWSRLTKTLSDSGAQLTLAGLAPGRDHSSIDGAETASGIVWPEELRSWYGAVDGYLDNHWVSLLPEHDLLSLSAALDDRERQISIWTDLLTTDSEDGVNTDQAVQAAGTDPGQFIAPFFPIAERDGYYLVLDTRPGTNHGCVGAYSREGSFDGPRWRSLSALLFELAESIEQETTFTDLWLPHVADGSLEWTLLTDD